MARRLRLDAELVRRGEARSREHASELIASGHVKVGGVVATKSATAVTTDVAIVVAASDDPGWASRGAHKLLGALEVIEPLGLDLRGARCLDAGASTGGFTDVLLRRGVGHVVAADVGYGQLIWRLQSDERVTVLDRTNVRELTVDQIDGPVDVIVSDLSFISLTLVLPALAGVASLDASMILMVKPQFEVGKERLGKGGVVRDPSLWAETVVTVAEKAGSLGWGTYAVARSPLPGPSGNVEFFLWLKNGRGLMDSAAIANVVTGSSDADEKVNP